MLVSTATCYTSCRCASRRTPSKFSFLLSIALCAQFPVGSHFSVVREASVACAARLAALATSARTTRNASLATHVRRSLPHNSSTITCCIMRSTTADSACARHVLGKGSRQQIYKRTAVRSAVTEATRNLLQGCWRTFGDDLIRCGVPIAAHDIGPSKRS